MKNSFSLILVGFAFLLSSCGTVNNRFLQADVIGFSDKVQTPYSVERGIFHNLKWQRTPNDLLTDAGKTKIKKDLQAIQRGNNTAAYYAMELAADRINYVRRKVAKNDPQTKYYIFLLTDGLDNCSPSLAKKEKAILFSRSDEKYRSRVHKKLKSAMGLFAKNSFEVYPMLYEGEDLREIKERNPEGYEKSITTKMDCFRYSSVGDAPQLIRAEDYGSIINQLRRNFLTSSYTFRVAKDYVNKRIRMNLVDFKGQKVVLEGLLKKSLFGYQLVDVTVKGATYAHVSQFTKDGKVFKAADKDDLNIYFRVDDLRCDTHPYFPLNQKVEQEIEDDLMGWTLNSEYQEVTVSALDTYFILVVDGSNSLDGKNKDQNGFEKELKMATDIVEMIINPNKGTK